MINDRKILSMERAMLTRQMDYLLELSRTLNFSRAAENLFITQPTLSYQVRTMEEELGFRIFDRNGRSVGLTPAGNQFIESLSHIRTELQRAIEQGQTYGSQYNRSISIGMSVRSMILHLPEAIIAFAGTHPTVEVVPYFNYYGMLESFLRGDQDIYFGLYDTVSRYPDIRFHKLYTSRIYLITELSDPLSEKKVIHEEDLKGRTLMIGGDSPNALKAVQQRVIQNVRVNYKSSPDHDNTLTNVAAHKGVCLSPGFLNDHSGQFAWLPFDCKESFECGLCTHSSDDDKAEIQDFIRTLQDIYRGYENDKL